ncbi:MAG: hypothetical protein ACR2JM_16695, partial [Mycobacterium sp.]
TAAIATAAAIVAATPALAPNISTPTPPALSKAAVELADFQTFLQFALNPSELAYAYFTGWGNALGPGDATATPPIEANNTYAPACNYNCSVNGLSGISYMLGDALINGDQSSAEWKTSAINNFYEGSAAGYGISSGLEYIAQTTAGAANPVLSLLITAFFTGPLLVTQLFTSALSLTAALVDNVPLVGPYIADSIFSYLYGFPNDQVNIPGSDIVGQQGIPGILAYWAATLTTAFGSLAPAPAAAAPAASALAAAPSVRSASAANKVAEVAAPAAEAPAASSAAAADNSPKVESAETATSSPAEESAPKAEDATATEGSVAPKAEEATESDAEATDSVTEAVESVEAPAETSAETPAETAPADVAETVAADATDTAAAAPAETKPAPVRSAKRPVRDAVDKVTKSIQGALGAKKADAAS